MTFIPVAYEAQLLAPAVFMLTDIMIYVGNSQTLASDFEQTFKWRT